MKLENHIYNSFHIRSHTGCDFGKLFVVNLVLLLNLLFFFFKAFSAIQYNTAGVYKVKSYWRKKKDSLNPKCYLSNL